MNRDSWASQIPMLSEERQTAQIPIEIAAGWLSDMKASHASRPGVGATRIQCTTMFVVHDSVEQAVQFGLEHGLKSSQHEVAPRGSVDEESQMQGNQ